MKTSYIYDTYLTLSNEISYNNSLHHVQMYHLIALAIQTTSYGLSINLTRNETY